MRRIAKIIVFGLLLFNTATPQDYWQPSNGPFGLAILAINSSGHIFAGEEGDGVFRSLDGGYSWESINTGMTDLRVRSLVVSSNDHIFVGTGGDGVFRTTDNGANWTPVNTGLTNLYVQSLALNSSGRIFAGTSGGVFRSTDNGANWTKVKNGFIYSLVINLSEDIFAGTSSGLFRSTDNGATWTSVINVGPPDVWVYSLTINSSGDIFAGILGDGVIRSTDNGANWIRTGLADPVVLSFAINSSADIFAGTRDNGVFRSTDNGASWTSVNTGLTNLFIWSLAINASDDIFAATENGVFRSSDNGANWMGINVYLPGSVQSLSLNASGHIFVGTGNGVFRSMDNGTNWITVNTGLTNLDVQSFVVNSSQHILAGTRGGGVFRSNDNGANWTTINTGLTNFDVRSLSINPIGHIFAGTRGGGVFRSVNNGESWTVINNGLTCNDVQSIGINSNGHIFAGVGNCAGVFRSTDNGNSWSQAGLSIYYVRSFTFNSSGHIFAGTLSGIFRSTDNGTNWTEVNNGLPTNSWVLSLAISASDCILSGTSGSGVFRSTNGGANWSQISAGLTNLDIRALAINSSGQVFAGTNGGGVFWSANAVPSISCSTTPFQQTDPLWKRKHYGKEIPGFDCQAVGHQDSIARWGCALTSLTMLFKYYGIQLGTDGKPVNPENLNCHLSTYPNGYLKDSETGRYLILNWDSAVSYAFNYGCLRYMGPTDNNKNPAQLLPKLNQELDVGRPVILRVRRRFRDGSLGDHFVLATCREGGNYKIYDPSPDSKHPPVSTLLASYENTTYGLRLFKFSPSTPCEPGKKLTLAIHSPVNLLVVDSSGRKTGIDRDSIFWEQIPGAGYGEENITEDSEDTLFIPTQSTGAIKTIYINDSIVGSYRFELTGTDTGQFLFEVSYQDTSGNQTAFSDSGTVQLGQSIGYYFKPGEIPSDSSQFSVQGDFDCDGLATSTDVVQLLNFVFLGTSTPCIFAAIDGDCDGQPTSTDVVIELNKVFLGTPFQCP